MAKINPQAEFYNNLGIKYEEAFGHDQGLIDFVNASLARLAPASSVLEVGSGTGKPTSEIVVSQGHRLHGIDFSPVMVELAKTQVPMGTFELINMLDYSPAQPFDAAFAVFSLFHFSREEMSSVAKRWGNWVKPGGFLFIGTMVAEDFDTEPSMFDADGHCARGVEHTFMGKRIGNLLYTKKGWESLLREGGFDTVHTELAPFQAPPEAQCDIEPHWYITAQRKV